MKRQPSSNGSRLYQWFLPLTVSPVLFSVVTSLCYFIFIAKLSVAQERELHDNTPSADKKKSSDPVVDVKRALKLLETSQGKELAVSMESDIRDLALLNYVDLQREFAKYLLFKPTDVEISSMEGVYWLNRAVALGDIDAKVILAGCHYRGIGVAKDFKTAANLFYEAAYYQHPMAQYRLGVMCGRGEGVAQSYIMAYKWLKLSAQQNFTPAMNSLETLKSLLTPEQMVEAERPLSLQLSSD